MKPTVLLGAAATAAVLLNACTRAEAGSEAPHAMHVTAVNYGFRAPDTVAAGLVRVRMDNAGTELHHTQMIRLDSGKTFDDLVAVLRGPWKPLPAWARHVGGPGAVIPGDSSEVLVPMPFAELLIEQHAAAIERGYGDREWASLGNYIAEQAGL